MDVSISSGPAFAMGTVTISPGGSLRVEAGAMTMTRGDVTVETSTQRGFFKGIRRALGGESFFVNDYRSASGGQVGVAATLPGDMTTVTLSSDMPLLMQSGLWSASDPTVAELYLQLGQALGEV